MGKRYYCDYCNKSFQDNRRSRRRHLQGTAHQRCKRQYYETYLLPLSNPASTHLLRSHLSGEEILQSWLSEHPEVLEHYKRLEESKKTTADNTKQDSS